MPFILFHFVPLWREKIAKKGEIRKSAPNSKPPQRRRLIKKDGHGPRTTRWIAHATGWNFQSRGRAGWCPKGEEERSTSDCPQLESYGDGAKNDTSCDAVPQTGFCKGWNKKDTRASVSVLNRRCLDEWMSQGHRNHPRVFESSASQSVSRW